MSALVLGCGPAPRFPGAVHVDADLSMDPDIVHDLRVMPWPFGDGAFDAVIAHHVAEHLPDTPAFLAECRRVLRPGGLLQMDVPSYRSHLAWGNIEHVRAFADNSFDSGHYTTRGWRLARKGFRIVGVPGYVWHRRVGILLSRWSPVPVVTGYRFELVRT